MRSCFCFKPRKAKWKTNPTAMSSTHISVCPGSRTGRRLVTQGLKIYSFQSVFDLFPSCFVNQWRCPHKISGEKNGESITANGLGLSYLPAKSIAFTAVQDHGELVCGGFDKNWQLWCEEVKTIWSGRTSRNCSAVEEYFEAWHVHRGLRCFAKARVHKFVSRGFRLGSEWFVMDLLPGYLNNWNCAL